MRGFDPLGREVSPWRRSLGVFVLGVILGALWYRFQLVPVPELLGLLDRDQATPSHGEVTSAPGASVVLETRRLVPSQDEHGYDTEADSTYEIRERVLDPDRTALVLIDVWARHPNDGWQKRAASTTEDKVAPLLALARRAGLTVVHAPHDREIDPAVAPLPVEIRLDVEGLDSTGAFDRFLRARGIDTLLYAGYASNWCLLTRPVGIPRMHELGYGTILVRDASIAFESPETLRGEWSHEVAVGLVELHWGESATVAALETALTGRSRPAGLS